MSVDGGVLPACVWDRGSAKAGEHGVGKVLGRCALQLDREGVNWLWEITAAQLKENRMREMGDLSQMQHSLVGWEVLVQQRTSTISHHFSTEGTDQSCDGVSIPKMC